MFCTRCGEGVAESAIYCARCGQRLADPVPSSTDLEGRVAAIEQRLPDSEVIDPRFWRRARAIWGHTLAVTAVLYVLLFIAMLIAGAIS